MKETQKKTSSLNEGLNLPAECLRLPKQKEPLRTLTREMVSSVFHFITALNVKSNVSALLIFAVRMLTSNCLLSNYSLFIAYC